jgi:hypothetical protein
MEILLAVVSVASLVTASVCVWLYLKLAARLNAALGGKDPESLENALASYFGLSRENSQRLDRLYDAHEKLAVLASLASQKISIVRFNPFGDTGGDQSFSLAVLDAHNSGYVLTSIHGRQGTRSYVKPIDYGKSKYALSEEEKQAVTQAAKRTPEFEQS